MDLFVSSSFSHNEQYKLPLFTIKNSSGNSFTRSFALFEAAELFLTLLLYCFFETSLTLTTLFRPSLCCCGRIKPSKMALASLSCNSSNSSSSSSSESPSGSSSSASLMSLFAAPLDGDSKSSSSSSLANSAMHSNA